MTISVRGLRTGVRLGLDVGTVRIGVARCDREGLLATPLETVSRGSGDLLRIAALVTQLSAVELVVGLPTGLSGQEGPAALEVRRFAQTLASAVDPIPVRLVDERLSTVSATRELRAAGISQRAGRAVVDQAAAAVILQFALDIERGSGVAPGELAVAGPADGAQA